MRDKEYKLIDKIDTFVPRFILRRIVDVYSYIGHSCEVQKLIIPYLADSSFLRLLFNFFFLERTGYRAWGISPKTTFFLTDLVLKLRPKTIVDCGTGRGISLAAELCGLLSNRFGRIISLEHQPKFAIEAKKKFVNYRNLVSIKCVPLRKDNSYKFIPNSQVDLIVVDGPPGYLSNGRLNTMRHLIPSLSPKGVLLLDDVIRESEKSAAKSICKEFNMSMKIIKVGNYIAILKNK
jgi:predicted O-methyltransferase YrrM